MNLYKFFSTKNIKKYDLKIRNNFIFYWVNIYKNIYVQFEVIMVLSTNAKKKKHFPYVKVFFMIGNKWALSRPLIEWKFLLKISIFRWTQTLLKLLWKTQPMNSVEIGSDGFCKPYRTESADSKIEKNLCNLHECVCYCKMKVNLKEVYFTYILCETGSNLSSKESPTFNTNNGHLQSSFLLSSDNNLLSSVWINIQFFI